MAAGTVTVTYEGGSYWVVHPTPSGVHRYQCVTQEQADGLAALLDQPPSPQRAKAVSLRAKPTLMARVSRALRRR